MGYKNFYKQIIFKMLQNTHYFQENDRTFVKILVGNFCKSTWKILYTALSLNTQMVKI